MSCKQCHWINHASNASTRAEKSTSTQISSSTHAQQLMCEPKVEQAGSEPLLKRETGSGSENGTENGTAAVLRWERSVVRRYRDRARRAAGEHNSRLRLREVLAEAACLAHRIAKSPPFHDAFELEAAGNPYAERSAGPPDTYAYWTMWRCRCRLQPRADSARSFGSAYIQAGPARRYAAKCEPGVLWRS